MARHMRGIDPERVKLEHERVKDDAFLVKSGVPLDAVNAMDLSTKLAWLIAIGELEGCTWDWSRMQWTPESRFPDEPIQPQRLSRDEPEIAAFKDRYGQKPGMFDPYRQV